MRIRRLTGTLIAAAAALVLASCANGDPASPAGQPGPPPIPTSAAQIDHNEADIAFAQGMIPHHAQAIAMARMASARAESPEVHDLAARIETAQEPEIETLRNWLEHWGAEVPTLDDPMGHQAHGMMSPEQMHRLGQTHGHDFDRMFLNMMIEHHQGAITMARTHIENGKNPAAIALAEEIIQTQQAEIEEMRALLAQN